MRSDKPLVAFPSYEELTTGHNIIQKKKQAQRDEDARKIYGQKQVIIENAMKLRVKKKLQDE